MERGFGTSFTVSQHGLVLREWAEADVPSLVSMFDTDEMDRWTPLPHPSDSGIAADYVRRAHAAKAEGTLQLAITVDGGQARGEVIMFPTSDPGVCEFAFAVGRAARGQGLAARAVGALLDPAQAAGYEVGRLMIAADNVASEGTAKVAGFTRRDVPLQRRARKGYVLQMATWERTLS